MENVINHFVSTKVLKRDNFYDDILKSGTGSMMSLTEAVHNFEDLGYSENFAPCLDHFEAHSGKIKLYPEDFVVDKMLRFENSSDPDDQSILYAISSSTKECKGLYIDSYGAYHDELSTPMMRHLRDQCQILT